MVSAYIAGTGRIDTLAEALSDVGVVLRQVERTRTVVTRVPGELHWTLTRAPVLSLGGSIRDGIAEHARSFGGHAISSLTTPRSSVLRPYRQGRLGCEVSPIGGLASA